MQPLEQKKRQKVLLGILAVVVIITAFVWYSNYQKKPVKEGESLIGPLVSGKYLKDVKLDLDILNDDLFKSLKSHGVLPVIPGDTGRDNPFSPY